MRKEQNIIEVIINLPRTFKSNLKKEIINEIELAATKYSVILSDDEKENIMFHTINQLENKVTAVARAPWEITDPTLKVVVRSNRKGVFQIELPAKDTEKFDVSFVRTHDEWKVDQDPNPDAILLKDFYTFFMGEVYKWARTGAFYGVGSYKE